MVFDCLCVAVARYHVDLVEGLDWKLIAQEMPCIR